MVRIKPKNSKKWCVIGAGPSGLIAARALKKAAIPYDQFERHEAAGGIWDINNANSPIYQSAHFISSKYKSGFYGFPMPEHYPDYPNHTQIKEYIQSFEKEYQLDKNIQYKTAVTAVEPIGELARDGWLVTLENQQQHHYRGIICAPGVTWSEQMPDYQGMDCFAGKIIHSKDYQSSKQLEGKKVLIIGGGNSGIDIACDAAISAKQAVISLRRGYHFFPKHIYGVPLDIATPETINLPESEAPQSIEEVLNIFVGDVTRFGLQKPDHQPFETHPIMNTQILHHLGHGDIAAKPEVKHFDQNGIQFTDGSYFDCDLVICATGYNYEIPYVDNQLFDWRNGRPDLYLNIFHREYQGLSVIGFIEFADAAYQRFDEMAQLVAMEASMITNQDQAYQLWLDLKQNDQPNLRGDSYYLDIPRNQNYVNANIYQSKLNQICQQFKWPNSSDELYQSLKRERSYSYAN